MHHEGVFVAHQGPISKGGAEGVCGDNVAAVVPEFFLKGPFFGSEGDFFAVFNHDALAPENGHIAKVALLF